MKLKTFNLDNSRHPVKRQAILRVNTQSGVFRLSDAASQLIGLTENNRVVMVQDQDSPADWYIKVSADKKAFPLRKREKGNQYSFSSTSISLLLLESIRNEKPGQPRFKSSGFKISRTPVELEGEKYWLIITSDLLNPKI